MRDDLDRRCHSLYVLAAATEQSAPKLLLGAVAALALTLPSAAKPVTRGPFAFACFGDRPATLTVTYLGADAGKARLTLRGESVVAKHAVSADGGLYTAKDVEFWNKGEDAVVEWRGEKLKCAIQN